MRRRRRRRSDMFDVRVSPARFDLWLARPLPTTLRDALIQVIISVNLSINCEQLQVWTTIKMCENKTKIRYFYYYSLCDTLE